MTAANEGNERLVTVHGLGVGDTSNLVVSIAQQRGYTVAATGPGQFRMMRQKRPTWAVVAAILTFPFLAIGLLFLLVKKTDSGTVAVFEARDGTKVRFVGGIDDEIVDSIASRTASRDGVAAAAVAPSVDRTAVASEDEIPKPMPPVAAPDEPAAQKDSMVGAGPAATRSSRTATTGSEPTTLIESSPIARPTEPSPVSDITDLDKTVARPRRASASSGSVVVSFPNGRSVPLSNGIVVGRSPQVPAGMGALALVPYPDGSLSKTHLTIEPTAGGITVTDLHSTNGTEIVTGDSARACPPGEAVGVDAGVEVRAGDVAIRIESSP